MGQVDDGCMLTIRVCLTTILADVAADVANLAIQTTKGSAFVGLYFRVCFFVKLALNLC